LGLGVYFEMEKGWRRMRDQNNTEYETGDVVEIVDGATKTAGEFEVMIGHDGYVLLRPIAHGGIFAKESDVVLKRRGKSVFVDRLRQLAEQAVADTVTLDTTQEAAPCAEAS
jgi:hypothetical protein